MKTVRHVNNKFHSRKFFLNDSGLLPGEKAVFSNTSSSSVPRISIQDDSQLKGYF